MIRQMNQIDSDVKEHCLMLLNSYSDLKLAIYLEICRARFRHLATDSEFLDHHIESVSL
jgi:hypothetical protein